MLKKMYTWIILLFVPMSLYNINIMTFTLSDTFLICFFVACIVNDILNNKMIIHTHIFLLASIIIMHMLIIILINQSDIQSQQLMRTLRYFMYLLFISMFVRKYFDLQLGWKLLKSISIFSSLFLILQYILMNYANYYLSGFIPGLPLAAESLNELGKRYALGYWGRPNSIFQEPAHFASYVLLYFGIALFENYKKEKYTLILIGLALILSGSSTGILTAIGLVFLWLGKLLKSSTNPKKVINTFLVVVFIAVLILLISRSEPFMNFVDRTFKTQNAINGRFGNYSAVFNIEDSTLIEKIIGRGMIKYEGYIPAVPRIYYNFGLVGLLTFCIYSLFQLFKKSHYKKIALVILLVSTLGTEIILGKFIILYLPFIIELKGEKRISSLV